MTPEFRAVGIGVLAAGAGVFGSHFSLCRDIAALRERMAKLEGDMDGLLKGMEQTKASWGSALLNRPAARHPGPPRPPRAAG